MYSRRSLTILAVLCLVASASPRAKAQTPAAAAAAEMTPAEVVGTPSAPPLAPEVVEAPSTTAQPPTPTAHLELEPLLVPLPLRELTVERLTVQSRLHELDAQRARYRLVAPTTLMVVAYAGAGVFAFFTIMQATTVRDIRRDRGSDSVGYTDVNGDGVVDGSDVHQARRAQWALFGVSMAHAALAASATAWFVMRKAKRAPLERERETLIERVRAIDLQLRMGLLPGGGAGAMQIQF